MRIQGIQGDTVRYRGIQPQGIIHEDTRDTRGYNTLQLEIQPQGIIYEDTKGYKGIQYITGGYSHRGYFMRIQGIQGDTVR